MEKISIKELVEHFEALTTDEERNAYLEENVLVNTYVPFVTKDAYARIIADESCFEHVNQTDEDGKENRIKTGRIVRNSAVKWHLFWRSVIDLYTNLQREDDNFIEEYDMLDRTGILAAITDAIPKGEFNEFNRICDYACDDLLYNNNSPHAFVSSQVERITTILGAFLSPVADKVMEEFMKLDAKDKAKLIDAFGELMKTEK